jgi:hypothetical protein
MYRIVPQAKTIQIIAKALSDVSHHDASGKDDGTNIIHFNRTSKRVDKAFVPLEPDFLKNYCAQFCYPVSLERDLEHSASAIDILASLVIKIFLKSHNGQGLLEGKARYSLLQSRVRDAALQSYTMLGFWSVLSQLLDVSATSILESSEAGATLDSELETLLIMPNEIASIVLQSLSAKPNAAVILARLWREAEMQNNVANTHIKLNEKQLQLQHAPNIISMPAFSSNAARHSLVREPGALHLFTNLNLRFEDVPAGVAALFYNGGELSEKQDTNPFELIHVVRANFPLLGLVGGSTKSFILGTSNLEVNTWLVCEENNPELARFDIHSNESVFNYIGRVTRTRHANARVEGSPMPFTQETLVSGVQLAIELRLRSYATKLEAGALYAALSSFQGILGGGSARGSGLFDLTLHRSPEDFEECGRLYEDYLQQNAELLREGLVKGTLGTKKVLL